MSDDQDHEDVEVCEIVITAQDAEWLATFCRSLIEDRLAAAVHIIEGIRTLYRWQDEIHDTYEARAHIRTRKACSETIRERVMAGHSYKVPSIVAYPILPLTPDYQRWILQNARPAHSTTE